MVPNVVVNAIALIVTLGILVTIHEYGHYWVARKCGVRVLRFSIGFGKPFKSWVDREGTEWAIAPIPLGGYVKMLGQEDLSPSQDDDIPASQRAESFAYKPLWQRAAIVAAGPVANFVLALVVFWIINMVYGVQGIAPVVHSLVEESAAAQAGLQPGDEILAVDGEPTPTWQAVTLRLLARMGETGTLTLSVQPANAAGALDIEIPLSSWLRGDTAPDPVADLGIVQWEIPAIVDTVTADSRAEAGGLRPGDELLAVSGTPIRGWLHWVDTVRKSPELDLNVRVQRGTEAVDLVLRPALTTTDAGETIGFIGASVRSTTMAELIPPEQQREIRYNPLSAMGPALVETWDKSVFVLDSIKKMVVGLISVKNINGPITIAQVAGETASYGLNVYLGFLAVLSISLGVLNLMPIPVLDGGHLLYYLVEGITRRPVPERIQEFGLQLGLLLISGIMVLAVYNDVSRLL